MFTAISSPFSPNCRVWAKKSTGGTEQWLPAVVQDTLAKSEEVRVLFAGAKNRKRLSVGDVVPRDVRVVLDPLPGEASGDVIRGLIKSTAVAENICRGYDKDDFLADIDEEIDDMVSTRRNPDSDAENQPPADGRKKAGGKVRVQLGKRQALSAIENGNLVVEDKDGKEEIVKVPKKEVSDYEKIRLANIAERQKMFATLKAEMTKLKKEVAPKPKPRQPGALRLKGFLYSSRKDPVYTRSRRNSAGSSEPSSGSNSGSSTPQKRRKLWEEYSDIEDFSDDEVDEGKYRRARNPNPGMWLKNPNVDILQPEGVTDDMLANVADRVSEKVYSQTGTTCHQCRQKTTDVKTVCRSGNCAGVRGFFCGVCLLNRYGQDAREALKDPNWMCPPCLDVCNCSICRNRLGKGATGPITWLAQAKGFKSVKDYLDSLSKNKGTDEYDE